MSSEYTFPNGQTISTRKSWNPHIYELAIASWRENNPQPKPPAITQKVKQFDGDREVVIGHDYQDPNFIAEWTVFNQMLLEYQRATLYRMAINPDSINKDLVQFGRKYFADLGVELPNNDVQAYISICTFNDRSKSSSTEESDDDNIDELDGSTPLGEFRLWLLRQDESPGAKLVEDLMASFRAEVQGEKDPKPRKKASSGK